MHSQLDTKTGRCPDCGKHAEYAFTVKSFYTLSDAALRGQEYPLLRGPNPTLVRHWLDHDCTKPKSFTQWLVRLFTGT